MCRYTGIDTTHARTNDIEKATEIDWKICSFWIKPTFGSKTSVQTRPIRHIFSNRVDKATLGLPETSDRIRRIDSIRVGEGQKSDRYSFVCIQAWEFYPGKNVFYCDGRVMVTKDNKVLLISISLITICTGLFVAFDYRLTIQFFQVNFSHIIIIMNNNK